METTLVHRRHFLGTIVAIPLLRWAPLGIDPIVSTFTISAHSFDNVILRTYRSGKVDVSQNGRSWERKKTFRSTLCPQFSSRAGTWDLFCDDNSFIKFRLVSPEEIVVDQIALIGLRD